jgi:hypothetical protein
MKSRTPEVTLTLGDEEYKLLCCLWGLKLAASKGYDISQLDISEEEASNPGQNIEQMVDLLWIGRLPFDEDLTRREIGMAITPGDLEEAQDALEEVIEKQFNAEMEEAVESADSGGPEGKE